MSRIRFPHPLVLLLGFILLAALLSYVVPAGTYTRQVDPVTGQRVVVAGTYHRVPPVRVDPFAALVGIPEGLLAAGSVVFLVFLVGGAFTVVDKTGVFNRAVDALVANLHGRAAYSIPISCLLFGAGGVLLNMQEEFIALIPVLLLMTARMGYNPIVAVAMSLGAATVGAAFSPVNPFQVGVAQKLAQLPLLSGSVFRALFLCLALGLWIVALMRYARNTRVEPASDAEHVSSSLSRRDWVILTVVLGTFVLFITGVLAFDWEFNHMSALFFIMGVTVGLIGRLGVNGTAEAYVEGFRAMAFAGLLIGFARAIFIVLEKGMIVDTLVYNLVRPLEHLPVALSAAGMMFVQSVLHFPVPSVSGQAVLTMPVLVPLSDLLGLSRQVTVLAYQYGAGLTELITPTNGALMAVIAAARVRFDEWLRFVLPLFALLFTMGLVGLLVAIAIRLA